MDINGEKIVLKPITKSDTQLILKWRNSHEVSDNFFFQEKLTQEMHMNWLNTKIKTKEAIQYIIYEKQNLTPVGTVYISNIDKTRRIGEFGFYIGETNSRGKGIGSESIKLVTDYAICNLHFNSLYARVKKTNVASINAFVRNNYIEINDKTFPFSHDYDDNNVIFLRRNKP